jgi:AAA domain, putative AbiEii toxin, Type IV TA system/AAA domain
VIHCGNWYHRELRDFVGLWDFVMYLREISIKNIRSIKEIEWKVPEEKADGWHVIIGDNGSGKSSFLRSIALGLIGPFDAPSLRQPWEEWLRKRQSSGSIELGLDWDEEFDFFSSQGPRPRQRPLRLGINLTRISKSKFLTNFQPFIDLSATKSSVDPRRHVWGGGEGWFCAAFGPYRRLTGGDLESLRISLRLPKLARYLSIFDERYALMDCIEWLQTMKFQQLESERDPNHKRPGKELFPSIVEFINQPNFLPHQAKLKEITSNSVLFVDGNGMEVRIEDLSDGYRSILSMTFELIRQLALAYGAGRVFDSNDPTRVLCPGVVLIDEIDVHLHPSWQRQIGLFLRKHFPKIQFIVTTHSPLICQAADVGTVFVLPKPGEEGGGEMLEGARLERLLYGNVLDAYGTEVFGRDVSRSDEAKMMRKRLAALNVKETREGLTEAERQEQERLRGAMPTAALSRGPSDDPNS